MPWIPRGLRNGIVTTRFPGRPDDYGPSFRSVVEVSAQQDPDGDAQTAVDACPTNAISLRDGNIELDQGRCVLCAKCCELLPSVFSFDSTIETSTTHRGQLVVPAFVENDATLESLRSELARRTRALRRSVHIRHVDAGSDGSEEWEIAALTNPLYDVQRLGIFFTASPRHADLLLVTGVGSAGMREPLRHTFDVMPHPKVVVAAGVDTISGGLLGEGYASAGGVSALIPVDVFVPGSPPSPFSLLHGILLAVGLLGTPSRRSGDSS